ncbi:MAG: DinB family protein [Chloroflexi bacterium]|nr:DinB family protein [Chloroflexota bacterium]
MGSAELRQFVEYLFWANRRLLDAAARLPTHAFASTSSDTVRDLRATLVHELDVEWSWRLVLEGRPEEEWGSAEELEPEDFPDVATLRARWDAEERELRDWVASLSDEDLATEVRPALTGHALPLWYFVMHIVMHGTQQQADAATLLTAAGESPGEIGFLEFVAEQRGIRRA